MKHERSITLLDCVSEAVPTLRHRRVFQAIFGVLALVPLGASLTAIGLGTGRFSDVEGIPAELDSQLRYLGGIYFVVALTIGYAVLNIERARTITTVVGAAVFVGGLGRIASWVDVGRPDYITVFFVAVELLVVPAVVLAYRRSLTTSNSMVAS